MFTTSAVTLLQNVEDFEKLVIHIGWMHVWISDGERWMSVDICNFLTKF